MSGIQCPLELVGIASGNSLLSLFGPTAKCLTRLRGVRCGCPVEFLCSGLVPISHSFAIFGIVLPGAPARLVQSPCLLIMISIFAAVDIPVDINVFIDININLTAMPVTVAPGVSPCKTHRNTGAEVDQRIHLDISRRIIIVGRIGRIRP